MTEQQNRRRLQYPRRVFIRNMIRFAGRMIGALAARPQVIGRENLPPKGPLILVGNHIAVIEVGMMMTYTPYPLEVMAAGDIPLDPRYKWMADLWGIIPIKRGSMDRDGMNMALDVLEQGGVVGLFPKAVSGRRPCARRARVLPGCPAKPTPRSSRLALAASKAHSPR